MNDPNPTPEPLLQAAAHLRQGDFEAASRLLAVFLQEHPDSADGWVLFSYALDDPVRKLECAERALQLQPGHAQAARRTVELKERYPGVETSWAAPRERAEPEAPAPEQPGSAEPGVRLGQAEVRPVPQVGVQPGPTVGVPSEPQAGVPSEPQAGVPPEPSAGAGPEPSAGAGPEPSAGAGPEPSAGAGPEPSAGAGPKPLAGARSEPPAGARSEAPAPSDIGPPQVAPFTVSVAAPDEPAGPGEPQPAFMASLGSKTEADRLMAEGAAAAAQPVSPETSDQASAGPAEEHGQAPARRSRLVVVLASLFGCAVVAGAIGLLYSLFSGLPEVALPDPTLLPPAESTVGAVVEVASPVVLPPSWTPSPTPTITPTRTPQPTSTPTLTPTLVPPNATQLASMRTIGVEVADLRGLGFQGEVSAYVIPRLKARVVLEEMYRAAGGSEAQLEDYRRELVALGLVKPTYNLIDTVLNGLADAVGGFFDPVTKRLFVIGGGMGALERFVYSHEFAHALVDQHYPFDRLGAYPACQSDQDHCRAISGLVEGDATLVMQQWLQQFAGPQDLQDLFSYTPPAQALPEQFPPPFAIKDSEFPYYHGTAFVQFLHDRGNWAEVNRAYADLPLSSEQLLHPEKYLAGERPQDVRPPALEGPLGADWRLVTSDTLGEWGTYLLLGFGADLDAQLQDGVALNAAQGWGGDRYLVYFRESTGHSMLAALWRWDNETEAAEFHQALYQHVNNRFRGVTLLRSAGACWQGVDQVSCVYQRGAGVLWILAPDQPVLDAVLGAYSGFP